MTETGGRIMLDDAPIDASASLSLASASSTPESGWRLRPALAPDMMRSFRSKLLPRLFQSRKRARPAAVPTPQIDPIRSFAALTLGLDEHAASDFIARLLGQGVTVEAVFLEWLAPAARELGAQWETDETDFAKVTLGVNRLHMIMRRLGDDFCQAVVPADGGETALLTVIPGEQHSFGLSMVAEFFRRAGWNLWTGPFADHRELTSLVRNHWFDVVGFSVSSDRRLDDLKRDIDMIRGSSRNRSVGVMLGGPMLAANPELLGTLGADMISTDAATAPRLAHALVGQMKAAAAQL